MPLKKRELAREEDYAATVLGRNTPLEWNGPINGNAAWAVEMRSGPQESQPKAILGDAEALGGESPLRLRTRKS